MSQQVDYVLDYPAPQLAEPQPAVVAMGRWLTATLVLAFVMLCRELFQWQHIPIPQRVLASGFALLVLGSLAMTSIQASRAQYIPSIHGFKGRLVILALWVVWLAAWGAFRENFPNMVVKETVTFLMIVLLLSLGRSDFVWERSRVPFLVAMYLGFLLVLLTIRLPGYSTGFEGTKELDTRYDTRHIDTIGASISAITHIGLLLGAWGLVRRKTDWTRILLLGALGVYLFAMVVLFEFRGGLATVAELLFMYVVLSVVQRRLRIRTVFALIVVAAIGLALAYSTGVVATMAQRFGERGGLFQSRIDEASAFFKDMGPLDYLVGRGMGGWYNGPNWRSATVIHGEHYWFSNHFGFLGFVLRGGVPFLILVSTFAFPLILPKPREWHQNEYNLVAAILTPVLLLNILINPIDFGPDAFFDFVVWGFCFARFSTPVTEMPQWTEAPPEQISYEY